jgi:3',5'-cyclic AMP phosphodiesterase CpdA
MNFARLLIVGFCASTIACSTTNRKVQEPTPARESHSSSPPSFSFIQMADTQFGFYSTPLLLARFGWSWSKGDFERETENFERAVTAADRLEPAFVVVCGDLVNSWGHEGQAAEFLRIRSTLDADIPLYVLPGNHDVGNTPTPESLAWYRDTFGRDWYAFDHEYFHGIVLNSSLFTAPEQVADEAAAQLAWLEHELERAGATRAQQIAVFMHYPLFLRHADEPDSYFNIPTETRQILLGLFERYQVSAVFAGHYHQNAYGRAGKLQMITTGAVGRPMGDAVSGFTVVDVYEDGLEHRYLPLESATPAGDRRD